MQAQKLILAAGDDGAMDPLFRIMTREGDYLVSMPIAEDPSGHEHQLKVLSWFMAIKATHVFTVAGYLMDPEAVFCFGASEERQAAAVAEIEREPTRFGAVEWLSPEWIEDELLGLLSGGDTLDATAFAEVEAYFGPNGRFPAVRLGGGSH
jgi:hypothetical protein